MFSCWCVKLTGVLLFSGLWGERRSSLPDVHTSVYTFLTQLCFNWTFNIHRYDLLKEEVPFLSDCFFMTIIGLMSMIGSITAAALNAHMSQLYMNSFKFIYFLYKNGVFLYSLITF